MPYSIGQIITMNLDGTDRDYRILKLNVNIAEVVCMSTVGKSAFGSNNTYAGSTLDEYLNTTWYNTLTATAKAAIVSKTFNQDSWYVGTSGSPVYSGHFGPTVPGSTSYSISKGSATYGAQITRNVYALSVQDVIDYITNTDVGDGKLENYNFWKMLWNATAPPSPSEYPWLRTASASRTDYPWALNSYNGYAVGSNFPSTANAVRPALTIDLSKIFTTNVTLDLSTIGLSTGTHSIQMKLSDDGVTKADSELSNAVSYTVQPGPAGETWVINETPNQGDLYEAISFSSNNQEFTHFEIGGGGVAGWYIHYDSLSIYNPRQGGWRLGEEYRTVYFPEPPTDDLRTWLQTNAVKQ